jgi:hypothetical protein
MPNEDYALEKEREIVARALSAMEEMLARVVAQQVVIEDLMPGQTGQLVSELEIALLPKVREAVAEQIDVIRGNSFSTSPAIDWNQMVRDLVESSRDVPPPPNG